VRFGGFGSAEFGASDVQLQSDIARLVVTTTDLYDARSALRCGDRGHDAEKDAPAAFGQLGMAGRQDGFRTPLKQQADPEADRVNRRTNDILRLVLAAAFLGIVIAGSLITRTKWVALEKSWLVRARKRRNHWAR